MPKDWLIATNGKAIVAPVTGCLPSSPNFEIVSWHCVYQAYASKRRSDANWITVRLHGPLPSLGADEVSIERFSVMLPRRRIASGFRHRLACEYSADTSVVTLEIERVNPMRLSLGGFSFNQVSRQCLFVFRLRLAPSCAKKEFLLGDRFVNVRCFGSFDEMSIPEFFVWQNAGSESSQSFADTLHLKEAQRLCSGEGKFLWGVGNSISKSVLDKLLTCEAAPPVIFTEIQSSFRSVDVEHIESEAKNLLEWSKPKRRGKDSNIFTEYWEPPDGSQVMSHDKSDKKSHYALVCQSESPLSDPMPTCDEFGRNELTNLESGKKPGSSQTVVVARYQASTDQVLNSTKKTYKVAARAQLIYPYVVKFTVNRAVKHVVVDPATGRYPV